MCVNVYLGANIEIIHCMCAHEGHLTVGVGVDAAGDDELPRGVDHPGAPRDLEVEADLLDGLVLNVDIRSLTAILIDNLASLDQDPDKVIISSVGSSFKQVFNKNTNIWRKKLSCVNAPLQPKINCQDEKQIFLNVTHLSHSLVSASHPNVH